MPEKLPSASDTANEYLYDAFISYRHNPLDMSVALRLQQLLERRKGSDDKYLRVFRDQSELPTSGDLGQDIRTALEHSRYLIVICTPAYRESKWCMAELQYFRELHGHTNHHILPLLAEGEPMEAFPELLLWELRGATDSAGKHVTVRTEVEPLGADIRSSGRNGWKKKLQTEYYGSQHPFWAVNMMIYIKEPNATSVIGLFCSFCPFFLLQLFSRCTALL